jgi:hypothetical protein
MFRRSHASAYADVRGIMDSDLRARLKEALRASGAGQREFQDHTGIDIEKDIDYVVASLPRPRSRPPRRSPWPVQRHAARNVDSASTVARSRSTRQAPDRCPTGTQRRADSERQCHTWPSWNRALVASASRSAVKTSIDAQLSAHSITGNNEMMELVNDIGQGNNAWAVGRFDVLRASKAPGAGFRASSSAQVVRRSWTCERRVVRKCSAPKHSMNRPPRTYATSSVAFLGLARMQAQADPRTQALVESSAAHWHGKTVALSFTVPAEILQMIPEAPVPQCRQSASEIGYQFPAPAPATTYSLRGPRVERPRPFTILPFPFQIHCPRGTASSSTGR